MSSPKFSILMPVVKTRYFKEAFESVLIQSFKDYEIIVLDNQADADLLWVTTDARCRLIRNETRLQPAENWNKGIKECLGEYILLLSDDDILLPSCLALIHGQLVTGECPHIIRLMRENMSADGARLGFSCPGRSFESPEEYVYNQYQFRRGQVISDIVFRRDAALAVGGFKSLDYAWGTDHLFALELAFAAGGIRCLNEVVLKYRVHPGSLSSATDLTKIARMMAADMSWTDEVISRLSALTNTPYRDVAIRALHAGRQDMQDFHYSNAASCGLIALCRFHRTNRTPMGSARRSLFKALAFLFAKKTGLSRKSV